ncbi:MAG: hypothetical protein KJ818_00100 [Candidatus Omnitrophica bacterium]|nr:hypothetical protein [Candidatus Omnitrophota bacterium]
MIFDYIKIFLIGVLEDFLLSFNTKAIQRNNLVFSFVIAFLSAIIWYYVIVMVVENINKFWLVITYACGGGIGDMITISFDNYLQRVKNWPQRILSIWPFKKKRKKRRNLQLRR